ncbi:ABC-three component system protein [Aminobacter sp. MSH1]|uniref:ABC-three component system protein n=1 Tax=Aminobacter sp. MSH1 TaxID=374606 RepID=UPI00131ED303|nr:ABC-three component system protein [Aminobacter sp. MSH1]
MKLKTSVPGQYLGYGLQPTRLCFHLMNEASGSKISLEHLDDVAIHHKSGTVILEQSKSALSGNPASNKSADLWKALSNWAELPRSLFDSVDLFRYYVTPFKSGDLVRELNEAKDVGKAATLLKRFKTKSFKGAPGIGAEPLIAKFLAAGDPVCLKVIERFELLSENDPLETIRGKLAALLPEENLDRFCEAAIGMAKAEVEGLIRKGKVPLIETGGFRKKLRAFIRKYDFSNLLAPTTSAPADHQISDILARQPTFVQQLSAIDPSSRLMAIAVSDFLRATADKVTWADAGSILETSLDELDESLVRHHRLTADELSDTHAELEAALRGRQLYRRCTELQLPLEGRTLPAYFVSGEYNCLADDRRLGWHPNYLSLFPSRSP